MVDIDELYTRHIKPLSPSDQRRLLARMARGLMGEDDTASDEHSLLELEGVGAEIWQGVDAQAYVHTLRDEWEPRS